MVDGGGTTGGGGKHVNGLCFSHVSPASHCVCGGGAREGRGEVEGGGDNPCMHACVGARRAVGVGKGEMGENICMGPLRRTETHQPGSDIRA